MTLRERLNLPPLNLPPLRLAPGLRRALIRAGWGAGALIGLFALAIVILPHLIPQEVYRAEIEKAGRAATGREVTLSGPIRVSVFPRIEAQAGPASIAQPDRGDGQVFSDQPFASIGELRAAVSLWPLLFGGRIEIEEFVLVEPAIRLISLKDGSNNWTFTPEAAANAPAGEGGRLEGRLQDLRIEKGEVVLEKRKEGRTDRLTGLELRADMDAWDRPLSLQAKGLANDLRFDLSARLDKPEAALAGRPSPVRLDLNSDLIRARAEGELALGQTPAFDLAGQADIPSLSELAAAAGLDTAAPRPVLGRLTLEGAAFGDLSALTIKIASAHHDSALLSATLRGEAQITDGRVGLTLDAQAEAPRLGELARAMGLSAPGEAVLGKAVIQARLTGAPDDLVFETVRFSHDSGLLDLTFNGRAKLGTALSYQGRLRIAAPDLRGLAAAAGAPLPQGTVYRSFFLEGDTSGDADDVLLSNASLSFDDIRARGQAGLRMGGKPRLTGALKLAQSIDITPYALEAGTPGRPQTEPAWPQTPVDLSPLRLADADLSLEAAGLRFGLFDFGPSRVSLSIAEGRLVADLEETTLFGGKGSAQLVADAGRASPALQLSASIRGLGVRPLLKAAAGFDALEGAGDLSIALGGSGGDLRTLMGSLVGSGRLQVRDGVLRGVDLPALADAARTALGTREIRGGAISSLAQTRFATFETGFAMADGLAVVDGFTLRAPAVSLTGAGALDIGRREAQLSLFPQYVNASSGLNGYGLPLRLSGAWNGITLTPDWDWLASKASAALADAARASIDQEVKAITSRIGARLGLGRPLTSPSGEPPAGPAPAPPSSPEGPGGAPATDAGSPAEPATGAPASPAPGPAPAGDASPAGAPPAPAPTPEDRLRSEAQKALDRLLGRN